MEMVNRGRRVLRRITKNLMKAKVLRAETGAKKPGLDRARFELICSFANSVCKACLDVTAPTAMVAGSPLPCIGQRKRQDVQSQVQACMDAVPLDTMSTYTSQQRDQTGAETARIEASNFTFPFFPFFSAPFLFVVLF
jgi:hypothetical protein